MPKPLASSVQCIAIVIVYVCGASIIRKAIAGDFTALSFTTYYKNNNNNKKTKSLIILLLCEEATFPTYRCTYLCNILLAHGCFQNY